MSAILSDFKSKNLKTAGFILYNYIFKLCAIVTFSFKSRYLNPNPNKIMKTTHLLLSSLLLFFIGCTNAQWNKTIKGNGKATKLKLSISGSGDMKVAADATAIKATISGSGDIDLSGKADELDASVTGSGDITAYAKNLLTVKIVGSGDVHANRDVATINKKVVGSGKVSKY